MDWQPIETAPKDGEWLLLFGDGYGFMQCGFIGYWGKANSTDPFVMGDQLAWRRTFGGEPTRPTHWMQLPQAPQP